MSGRARARAAAAALGLLAAACTHPYRPPAGPEDGTALVRFETRATAFAEFEFFSTFYIHARDYGRTECPGRWLDGGEYLGRIDMEREGDSVEIRVPTATRIFFSASYSSGTFGATITCALTYGFVPRPGHSYLILHSGNRRACEVLVRDLTEDAPVELMGRDACPESV